MDEQAAALKFVEGYSTEELEWFATRPVWRAHVRHFTRQWLEANRENIERHEAQEGT